MVALVSPTKPTIIHVSLITVDPMLPNNFDIFLSLFSNTPLLADCHSSMCLGVAAQTHFVCKVLIARLTINWAGFTVR